MGGYVLPAETYLLHGPGATPWLDARSVSPFFAANIANRDCRPAASDNHLFTAAKIARRLQPFSIHESQIAIHSVRVTSHLS